ncbi:LOW QUALITY PROTEIN: PHD finger protein 7-like [Falco peregrinus]|uniref:LOW QUALITY PROTEIN: PHD finger protein 7-like n=1 Tax=Falco peregrinus TaxID=8954 RepID=UPI00247933B6|nr:LOW QUALITY PROTEIN: PHD finger protein 7-like [Falco peregrinus]
MVGKRTRRGQQWRRLHQTATPDIAGELCQKHELCVHENCVYHASRLRQRGADQHGFYGFLKSRDVRRVMKRTAQKRCCICQLLGASISCRGWRCCRTFHLPCGSERGCVSQFFGEYRYFCWRHRPVQRVRATQQDQTLCLICRDEVAGRPCYTTMVCPSRASTWSHRRCIQGQALRSGLHHFRSPLCRDMTAFQAEMFRLGIKIPNRDAAWEEEGSLLDLVLWQSSCDADQCLCPLGRDQAEQAGPWRLLVCSSCGSRGTRQCCSALEDATESWECRDCSGTHSVPDIAAGPDSCRLAQGPWHSAPSPGTLAEEEEARLLEGQPDTQLPSQLLCRERADPHLQKLELCPWAC